jgi:hypothetical protein
MALSANELSELRKMAVPDSSYQPPRQIAAVLVGLGYAEPFGARRIDIRITAEGRKHVVDGKK